MGFVCQRPVLPTTLSLQCPYMLMKGNTNKSCVNCSALSLPSSCRNSNSTVLGVILIICTLWFLGVGGFSAAYSL